MHRAQADNLALRAGAVPMPDALITPADVRVAIVEGCDWAGGRVARRLSVRAPASRVGPGGRPGADGGSAPGGVPVARLRV
jgi:hypothetical protein